MAVRSDRRTVAAMDELMAAPLVERWVVCWVSQLVASWAGKMAYL